MEAKNNLAVAFTGHRKERILQGNGNNLLTLAQIKDAVVEMVTELYGKGYKAYYTGMANGFDMIAAEAVLQVREEYGDIVLIAAVPFRKQPLWFDAEDQLLYARLLERTNRVVMVSENYHKGCYLRRDEYMVRKADMIIAYWDHVPDGGTFYTMNKALESGKPVINLYERMKKRSLNAGGFQTAPHSMRDAYSAESEESARCFLRSSFFSFCSFFLASISAIICFRGLTVSGSSRLNRLK